MKENSYFYVISRCLFMVHRSKPHTQTESTLTQCCGGPVTLLRSSLSKCQHAWDRPLWFIIFICRYCLTTLERLNMFSDFGNRLLRNEPVIFGQVTVDLACSTHVSGASATMLSQYFQGDFFGSGIFMYRYAVTVHFFSVHFLYMRSWSIFESTGKIMIFLNYCNRIFF